MYRQKKRILVTSIGSNVGGNILQCLSHRRDEFYFIGTNMLAESAFNFMCDEVYLAPAVADEKAFIEFHSNIINQTKPDLVLAGRDQDVTVLAKMKQNNVWDSTVFLLPSLQAALISNDKYESYIYATEHGLPFAKSAVSQDDALQLASDVGYPLIAKPRMNGHASKDVFIVRNTDELIEAISSQNFVVQEMIGQKHKPEDYNPVQKCRVPLFYSYAVSDQVSCQALVGLTGDVLYSVASMNYYSYGRSQKYIPLNDADILETVREYATALAGIGHLGPLNLQGRRDQNGQLKVYEINMRYTGATHGRSMLGWKEVEFAVDYIFNGKRPKIDMKSVHEALAIREPQAYILNVDDIKAMNENGLWRRNS